MGYEHTVTFSSHKRGQTGPGQIGQPLLRGVMLPTNPTPQSQNFRQLPDFSRLDLMSRVHNRLIGVVWECNVHRRETPHASGTKEIQ